MKNGFTLLELLIVIAIVGMAITMGAPSYRSVIQNHRADVAIQQVYRAICLAKSEAIKRNQMVTLCPSNDGKSCNQDWSKGYLLFVDLKENGILDSDDIILNFYKALNKNDMLKWKDFQNKSFLQITPMGTTNYQNGSFNYCIKGLNSSRALIINTIGRMRFEIKDGFVC